MVADDFLSREHSRRSLGKRSREEIAEVYGQYQGMVLKGAGLEATPKVIGYLLKRWYEIDFKLVLYADVAPALDGLKGRGLTLGLISNVDRDIDSLYRELGLADWLQVKVTSKEAGFNKPHPRIFQTALEQAGVEAAEAIYVGDQYQVDVVGANGAGMRGILLDRYGFFEGADDSPRIRLLTELADYL